MLLLYYNKKMVYCKEFYTRFAIASSNAIFSFQSDIQQSNVDLDVVVVVHSTQKTLYSLIFRCDVMLIAGFLLQQCDGYVIYDLRTFFKSSKLIVFITSINNLETHYGIHFYLHFERYVCSIF